MTKPKTFCEYFLDHGPFIDGGGREWCTVGYADLVKRIKAEQAKGVIVKWYGDLNRIAHLSNSVEQVNLIFREWKCYKQVFIDESRDLAIKKAEDKQIKQKAIADLADLAIKNLEERINKLKNGKEKRTKTGH